MNNKFKIVSCILEEVDVISKEHPAMTSVTGGSYEAPVIGDTSRDSFTRKSEKIDEIDDLKDINKLHGKKYLKNYEDVKGVAKKAIEDDDVKTMGANTDGKKRKETPNSTKKIFKGNTKTEVLQNLVDGENNPLGASSEKSGGKDINKPEK